MRSHFEDKWENIKNGNQNNGENEGKNNRSAGCKTKPTHTFHDVEEVRKDKINVF